ncbi:hypothetical protein [Streptomyces sp. NPDC059008]|uniref:hypothetical protein n=1 Tax=Streptomyces sp. NPDC059008 TaxID=3346693 RepID=UPI0036C2600A
MDNDLQQLVMTRLTELGAPHRPMSYRAAAARSHGLISHGTIGRLARGEHTGILEDQTLDGLALALALPRAHIERAAGLYRERPAEPFTLPPRASRLTRREREVVLSVVDALLTAADRGKAHSTPRRSASPAPAQEHFDLVAYTSDGSGAVSAADLETIRRHEQERHR